MGVGKGGPLLYVVMLLSLLFPRSCVCHVVDGSGVIVHIDVTVVLSQLRDSIRFAVPHQLVRRKPLGCAERVGRLKKHGDAQS